MFFKEDAKANPTTGRCVVKDDITNEILQVGGDNFEPPAFYNKWLFTTKEIKVALMHLHQSQS